MTEPWFAINHEASYITIRVRTESSFANLPVVPLHIVTAYQGCLKAIFDLDSVQLGKLLQFVMERNGTFEHDHIAVVEVQADGITKWDNYRTQCWPSTLIVEETADRRVTVHAIQANPDEALQDRAGAATFLEHTLGCTEVEFEWNPAI